MIDIKSLERTDVNPASNMTYAEEYRRSLKNRGADPKQVDYLLEINAKRKHMITQAEAKKAEQNKVGEEIARRKRNKEDATELLTQMQAVSTEAKALEAKAAEIDQEIHNFALTLP